MPGPCADLRVLELSNEFAGSMAAMILADFGADVVRVEPQRGDPGGSEPVDLFLNRGKKSIALDLHTDEGRAEVHRLVHGVDVIVETLAPGEPDRLGLAYDQLSAVNPLLVYCSITGFGPTGPFAHVPPDDGVVMAKGGIFRDQPGRYREGDRPVFRSTRDGSYFAAMLAAQGILAALRVRDLTGHGQRVETSMLEALTWRLNPRVRWLLREHEEPPLNAAYAAAIAAAAEFPQRPDPQLTGMLLQCKDGRWIIHMLFERNFFPSWINVLGFDWIWEDDRFQGAPRDFPDPEAKFDLADLLAKRMKEKTAAEWMELYVANGNVCADIVETTQEALRHPQIVEGGYLLDVDDPRVGRITELAPLAKLPGAPPSVRGPAPKPGQHTDEILSADVVPTPSPAPTRRTLAAPLEGITIVEAATHYATPASTALLSDLGARVIKVEPVTGDPYRRAANPFGFDNLVRATQGKEDIAVNLKDARGQEIVHRLVARADAFIHNYRVGVPERLRIDYETLRAINPRLVYQYGASYGSTGPYRRQPAIDHVIAAFAGTGAYQAGEGNAPLAEQGADPVSAAANAVAMLLAFRARDLTGDSQYVESAMILSNLYHNADDALSYAGKPSRPTVDHLQLGTGATYRLYETASAGPDFSPQPYENPNPHWVFLSARDDATFTRFCSVAGRDDLTADSRFATAAARAQNREALEAELEAVFRTRSVHEWEAALLRADVGCVIADAMSHMAFLHKDSQARALGLLARAEHPRFGGTYWRHAPAIRFSRTPGVVGAYCETGEHTRTILQELGYDQDDITQLKDAGVIHWPADQSEPAATTP